MEKTNNKKRDKINSKDASTDGEFSTPVKQQGSKNCANIFLNTNRFKSKKFFQIEALKQKKIKKETFMKSLLKDSQSKTRTKFDFCKKKCFRNTKEVTQGYDILFDRIDYSKKIEGHFFQVKEQTHQIELRVIQKTLHKMKDQNIMLYLMQIGECTKLKALIIQLDQIDVFVSGDLLEIKKFLISASTQQTMKAFVQLLKRLYQCGSLKFQFIELPLLHYCQKSMQCELFDLAILEE